jgi:glycosyltransferase involved in cell wall biosynthesis
VTGNYPSPAYPNRGTFVRQLVEAVAEQGVRCTVIHPGKLNEWWRERCAAKHRGGTSEAGVNVCRPLTLSLSNRRLGSFNTFTLTHASFQRAVWRALRCQSETPDAVYGHFLYPAGAAAVWAAQRIKRPGFVAVGEGTFWTLRPFGVRRAQRDFSSMTGAIAVSSVLQRQLVAEVGFPAARVAVFPNGVDLRKFHPRARVAMRRKHGLPEDKFLVIYVGNFIEPKGVSRVAEAINDWQGVAGIFVGAGPRAPRIPNLAYCGRVPHEQVPELLSAADCFVLPSDVEGSSNATLEAMACGVPVVVSDLEFNDELVKHEVTGLRVLPSDVHSIRDRIRMLMVEEGLRNRLVEAALRKAASLEIGQRAASIVAWMARMASAAFDSSGGRQTCVAGEDVRVKTDWND